MTRSHEVDGGEPKDPISSLSDFVIFWALMNWLETGRLLLVESLAEPDACVCYSISFHPSLYY